MNGSRPERPGLTLIELLAALAILAGVVSAGSAWTVALAKSAQQSAQSAQEFGARSRVLAVLQQDLDSAQPRSVNVQEGTLELITAHRPGDAVPAWRTVRWSFDPMRHQLTREEGPRHLQQVHRQSIQGLVVGWSATLEEAGNNPPDMKPDTLKIVLEFGDRVADKRENAVLVWRRER